MPPETPTAPARKTTLRLSALSTVVLLAHVSLLYGSPVTLTAPGFPSEVAFSTRMIAPVSTSQPQPVEAPAPAVPAVQATRRILGSAPSTANLSPVPVANTSGAVDAGLDADYAPTPTEVAPPVPTESASGVLSQLLAASGPPANLKSAHDTKLLAATDDIKPSMGTNASAGGPATKSATTSGTTQNFVFPPSMHLKYSINGEVKGFPYFVKGDLQWKQDGKTYDARMEVSHFLLGSRVQTSRGDLGVTGLEPTRFGDKVRSEVAAHFDRSKGKVTFSANTPEAPLVMGMQDHLSALLQLGAMLGGAPGNFPEGTTLPLEAVGPRSVESWVFKVGPQEKLTLPGGQVSAIKLVREAVGDYGTRGEVWLAPSMGYLPVRIRLIEPNGNFVDQKWSDTIAP